MHVILWSWLPIIWNWWF